jgi:hypothetical protein
MLRNCFNSGLSWKRIEWAAGDQDDKIPNPFSGPHVRARVFGRGPDSEVGGDVEAETFITDSQVHPLKCPSAKSDILE